MAASMALQALAIDAVLPALPQIGRAFAIAHANQLQWVIHMIHIALHTGKWTSIAHGLERNY